MEGRKEERMGNLKRTEMNLSAGKIRRLHFQKVQYDENFSNEGEF